jgi:hypothetical protein
MHHSDFDKSRTTAPRHTLSGILGVIFAALVAGLPEQASAGTSTQLRADFDLGAQWRMNSIARVMAGMPPLHPAHFELAESEAWKSHAVAMQGAWQRLSAGRVAAMAAWRDSAISATCPVGKTLLYPFSGPDFFNAWWLFPDCETFVMFGLEHLGDAPNIESMNMRQFARLLADVRAATSDFIDRNYFITENMARQLHTAQLRGVSIEFRAPGSPVVRRMQYFSADVTDTGLTRYPELLAYMRSAAPTTMFLKSASYLLHNREFAQMRDTLLDVSGFLVQDDFGLPYALLAARGWQVRLHGRYDVPIPPFERAYQAALARAYNEQRPELLPFTFGYQYHDARDERSNVMVARGPVREASRGSVESGKDVVLRTSGRLGR